MLLRTTTAVAIGTAIVAVLTGFGSTQPEHVMEVPLPPILEVEMRPPLPPPMPEMIVPQEPPKAPEKPAYRTVKVLVTACSPEDPHDLEYYAKYGYAGRKTRAVAADLRQLPKGTLLSIPGYHKGAWVPVDSAGGRIIRRSTRRGIIQIDVKFATFEEAKQWGRKWLHIKIKED